MSDPEDDQPVHIKINNDSDSDSGDENQEVRIKIVHDSSDDDDDDNNAQTATNPTNKALTPPLPIPAGGIPAQDQSNTNNPDPATSSPLVVPGGSTTDPEPWDDSILDRVQSRDRVNVSPEEQKLMKLRAKHSNDPEETITHKPGVPPVSPPASPSPKVPDRRLTPSKQEEKRDLAVQHSLFGLPPTSTSGTPSPLQSPPPSSPSASQSPPNPPKPKQNPFTIRTKLIARTLINIDLTNIKCIDDIEDALAFLHPDSTPYEGLVILPPIAPEPEPQQQPTQTETGAQEQAQNEGKGADTETNNTDPAESTTATTDGTGTAIVTAAVVGTPPSPADDKKAKEEEEKKRKEEEKKAAEAEKKRKEDEKKAADEEAKRKKEEEKKKREDDKKAAEDEAKKKKEDAKKAKEDEKKAKEEEAKRKKEEEKKKKEEEKLAKKNKGKAVPPVAATTGAAVTATPTPAEISTTSTPDDENNSKEPSVSTKNEKSENDHEPSVSRSGEISSAVRLGGPNAPCAIPYHDTDFPQPITFEQATEILKSQKPYKIPSKFQKANVFGTSGFKKSDHPTCYFYQYLWDTDFDPTNRAHVLLLNAFYMYLNDQVITPNWNADPLNKDLQRPAQCEVPELTGEHWVTTLRASNPDEPWGELLGLPVRYTILRALEQDLKPSILPLYLALYLLQGSPNAAFKKVVVALLRQFFSRDNATSTMSYMEIFTPLGYIINSLIMSNTAVHAEPFYRMFYKFNLKKEFGQWIPFDDYTLNGFLLAVTEYSFVLSTTFWFRHLIQQYDYPTLVCAVRQRLLSGVKAEFDRIDVEYCKGGYASYYNDIMNDNYLAQDLKVVFAEQKRQKHLLTPLEQQMHMNQQQRGGSGRNSISHAPTPTSTATSDDNQGKTNIGPNIVVGKAGPSDSQASPRNEGKSPPPPRTAAMNMVLQLQKAKAEEGKKDDAVEEDDGEKEEEKEGDEAEKQQDDDDSECPSDDDVEFRNDASDSDDAPTADAATEQQ